MQYFSFHIGDYTTATVHLSPMEDLTYRRLIDFYYMKEAPIPLKTDWVARRLRVATEDVENILKEFFVKSEDGWKNERCDEDIAKYHAMANRNRSNGSRGGRPKKNPKKPTGLQVGTDSKPTGKPTINHEPLTINQDTPPKGDPSFKQMTGDQFKQEVWKIGKDKHAVSMMQEFFEYWTEESASGTMRFQLEKTWSTSRRLSRWAKNNFGNQRSSSGSNPIQNPTSLPTTEQLASQEGVISTDEELEEAFRLEG